MANNQNLKPCEYKLSREEAKKGGINSGIARRKAKTMKETLLLLLDTEYKKGVTYREAVNQGLLKGAIRGDPKNYKTILETTGEVDLETKTQCNGVLNDLIEAMNNVKKS